MNDMDVINYWPLPKKVVLNVVLRVPSFFLADILLRNNFVSTVLEQGESHQIKQPAIKYNFIYTYFAVGFVQAVFYGGKSALFVIL